VQLCHRTLYVDALTYQPLRTVTVADGNPSGQCGRLRPHSGQLAQVLLPCRI
jgi:hypothetical protein